jgi:probable HAF family extracellular repeat protein
MQDLGTLGGGYSEAYGVSADGSVVVGWSYNAAGGDRAFRWTASGGMEDLNTTYASLLTNGSVLLEARAISPDGRYIVGWGYNAATGRTEAFLLDTGFPLTTAMWTPTAVWMTPTCCKCCSRLAGQQLGRRPQLRRHSRRRRPAGGAVQLRQWVLALTPAPLSLQRGEGRLFRSPLASVVILSLLIAAQSVLTDNQKVRFPLQAGENLQERGRVLSRSSFGSYCRQEEPKSDWFSEEIPQSYPRFSATACPIFASF